MIRIYYLSVLQRFAVYFMVNCFAYCLSYKAQAQQRSFESVCGTKKSIIIWEERIKTASDKGETITQNQTTKAIICLTTSQDSEVHHYHLSPSLTTLFWHLTDFTKHTDLTITLYNSNYHLKGTFNNRLYNKVIKSKGYPWHQNIAYSAGQSLTSKKTFKYECFRPDNLELYVMQAEQTNGSVIFNNQNACEVKVRLTGGLSRFWNCLYYFNAEDHQFIGYKGVNGGPGTPKTIITAK